MSICIPEDILPDVENIFKIKNSVEREKALNGFFDADSARELNKRFERTKLANKTDMAYKRFINESQLTKAQKDELLKKAESTKIRKEKLLEELQNSGEVRDSELLDIEKFADEVYKTKYNTSVTSDEARKIIELSNVVKEASELPKINGGHRDPAYGKAMKDLAEYTNEIKNKSRNQKLFGEGGRFQTQTEGMTGVQKTMFLLDNAKKYVSSNTFKSMMATMDASVVGIQGSKGILKASPKAFKDSFMESIKAFKNPQKAMDDFRIWLYSRKRYDEGIEVGLRSLGKEEQYLGDVLEKVPGVKELVTRADNMFTIFLQKARYMIYEMKANGWEKINGRALDVKNPADKRILEGFADFANKASGTSNLGKLEKFSPALNEAAFAGRYAISDAKIYTDPVKNLYNWAKLPARTAEEIAMKKAEATILKTNLKHLGVEIGSSIGTYYLISSLFPDNTEQRVNGANWMRFKIGDKWYNNPIAPKGDWLLRLGSKLITGTEINKNGVVTKYGEGYRPKTRLDVVRRTIRSKAAPLPALAMSILSGRTFSGEEMTFLRAISEIATPISLRDTTEEAFQIVANGEYVDIPRWFLDAIISSMGISYYE